MRTDLDHLPEAHQADLARLVEFIRGEVEDVEIIILFGSFARGDWKSEADLPPPEERRSGHASDYDILVITPTAELARHLGVWDNVITRADTPLEGSGDVRRDYCWEIGEGPTPVPVYPMRFRRRV